LVEPAARYEEVEISVPEELSPVGSVSGVLGVPEWWPTGSRVGVVLAHDRTGTQEDPILVALHRGLTERGFLSLRFNFPFAQLGKRRPDKDPVLERAFHEAVQLLGRDPTSAPAHLVLGGKGLGAKVAARIAMSRLRVEGLCFLGHPLHPADKPEQVNADHLYRIISPILFLQGTRDRYCDLDALRRTLTRIGAPKTLHVVAEADHQLKVLKKSGRVPEEVVEEVLGIMEAWINKVIEG
jgi:predicted alpha/beta-hydrolase family hydrolase